MPRLREDSDFCRAYTLTALLRYSMDFDSDFDDLFDNAVLCVALVTVQDETTQGNQDQNRKKQ